MLIARRGQGMVEQAGDCITERRQHPASVIKSTLVPESNKSSSYYPHSPASSLVPGAWAGWRQGRRVAASWRQLATGGGVAWPGAVSLVPGSGRAGCGHLAPTRHNNIASTTYLYHDTSPAVSSETVITSDNRKYLDGTVYKQA